MGKLCNQQRVMSLHRNIILLLTGVTHKGFLKLSVHQGCRVHFCKNTNRQILNVQFAPLVLSELADTHRQLHDVRIYVIVTAGQAEGRSFGATLMIEKLAPDLQKIGFLSDIGFL